MILFRQVLTLGNYLEKLKLSGKTIGFVPTMGALHKGHASLIQTSKSNADITVCSIFVNPTQFNDQKDYEKYPVTIADDIAKLEHLKCDILFLPSVNEIYPNGSLSKIKYDLKNIESLVEGKYRPGHFQGVSQVIDRLLHIVKPNKIFLGQKDFQQLLVIKRLVDLLHMPVEVIACPTLREPSGLAMSSRNMRLTEQQKEAASSIYKVLVRIKDDSDRSPTAFVEQHATKYLLNNGFEKVDYVSIVNAKTLMPLTESDETTSKVVLVAAFIGGVRLIDNMLLN
jgi:pantoate--beta-alanine ligase